MKALGLTVYPLSRRLADPWLVLVMVEEVEQGEVLYGIVVSFELILGVAVLTEQGKVLRGIVLRCIAG